MAVYTQLSKADIADFLAAYDVGELKSFKGIAEGVSNTNYLLTLLPQLPPTPTLPRKGGGSSSFLLPPPLRGRVGVGGESQTPNHRIYPPYIKEFARSLRTNQTEAEKKLWQVLRKNNLGVKFRRQFAVDNKYIADFICLEKRLIIEIDGGQHCESLEDAERTLYLDEQNFRVIRFWNNEILENLDGCYEILVMELSANTTPRLPIFTPHPNPPPQGGREKKVASHYILTLFEKNFNTADLPFFMNLTEHLADKGIVCPRPIHNQKNEVIGSIKGKPAVLIEFLQGQGNPHITLQHTYLVGELVAKLHLATQDFPQTRANDLSLSGLQNMFSGFRKYVDEINNGLGKELEAEFAFLIENYPQNLPAGIVHTDIFPDNVFFIDGNTDQPVLSGIIDFYFSCYDFWMYDLAIVLNAWCFNTAHEFEPERTAALFRGYNSIRQVTEAEKDALNILARTAAMRFLCTRSRDWLTPVDGALVNRKDPLEYVKKLRFWKEGGWKL